MLKKRIFAICIFAASCALSVQAQFGRMFTPDDILSNSLVNDIVQDKNGFIWIATQDGLNKYDGYRMTVYKNDDGSGLANSNAVCLLVGADDQLYVGTNRGAQRYNPVTMTFETLTAADGRTDTQAYINGITQLPGGDIAFSTSGVGVLRLKKGAQHLTRMNLPGGNYVRDVLEDHQGRMWIATQNDGVYLMDKGQKPSTSTHFFADAHRALMLKVLEDASGNIYAASMTNGLYKYNKVEQRFDHIAASAGIAVSAIGLQDDGKIGIGSDGDGLVVYDPVTNTVDRDPAYIDDADLSRAKIHAVLRDREGNFWFGLFQKGVLLSPKAESGFKYIGHKSVRRDEIGSCCVMAIFRDSKGFFWVGTDNDGIYKLDSNGRRVAHYPNPRTVMTIAEDGKGMLWVGTYTEGCGTLNPATGQYQRLKLPEDVVPAFFDIQADHKGCLWMATLGSGLLYYDIYTHQHRLFRAPLGDRPGPDVNTPPSNYLLALACSNDGQSVWISTSNGVAAFDIKKESFVSHFGKNVTLSEVSVNHIYEDTKGHLWIGTLNGIYCLDKKGKKLAHYTTHDGLANNGVRSIIGDHDGNLWLGTTRGLSKMTLMDKSKDPVFANYSTGNGLQGNEFSDRATVSMGDSIIVFGGSNGLTYFRPSQLQVEEEQIRVYMIGMITHEQNVVAGMKSGMYTITDVPVIDSDHFELGHQNNSFKLQFSTMEFSSPEQVVYEYSINNNGWNSLSPGQSEINFSNLGDGIYRFEVRAHSKDNISEPLQFTIVIHPAWYASGWFRAIILLLLAAAVAYYVRNRRLEEQHRLRLMQHIHAEEMGEAKLRFFMNISHDIRTPMTLIMTPLLSLIKNDRDPERQNVYAIIRRNAERILGLINQMMDLRKIDKGQMQMHMSETDIVSFIDDLHKLFTHQATSRHIQLAFEHDADHLPVWIDRKHFDKVIVNILSNAFKYTPTGGDITIRLTHDDKQVSIAISDNGEKIPEDKLDKIFERFYQTASAINDRNVGTGIGLDLSRSLVELHHGTIAAHNLSQGCEFVVTLPLGCEHLKPEEMLVTLDNVESHVMGSELDDLEISEELSTNDEEKTALAPETGVKRLVIAEDDEEIREFLTSELSHDYEVKACANGHEALAEVYRSMPDLVLSDVMMPVMDGHALCSKLKTNATTQHIPVILLTAKSLDEDKLEGLETGADAYIVKPFNMEILQRTIANLISTRRMLRIKYERTEAIEQMVDEVKVTTPDEKLLQRIMSSVNKHLDDSDLSVDMIADEVGLSRVHLYRKLKELTGQTPRDLVRNLRLKRAAQLLSQQGMNVTEVMYACGFSNLASFSNIFKKYFGMSPSEYAKEHTAV